jgi:hypothetical protein
VTYGRAPYVYAPRPHYGYGYAPPPLRATVVVVAPGPGAPPPVAAPVPAAPPSSVDYRDCGRGGPGRVQVTFDSNGRATDVRIVAAVGAMDEATARCVRDRFSSITIPAFVGPAQTFSWPVDLGGAPTAPGPSAPPAESEPREPPPSDDGHPGAGGWM